MGYEKHADPPNLLQISIPSYFRCPISSDLMSDPVTLCTGNTYDRASIQRWLSDGNNFCPLTRKHLHTQEMIPNHTLRRLIQAWRAGNERDGVDRAPDQQPAERAQPVQQQVVEMAKPIQLQQRRRQEPVEKTQLELLLRAITSAPGCSSSSAQALSDLRNSARESEENRRRIADTDAVGVLATVLCRVDAAAPAVDDAIATLALLPINSSHRKLLAHSKLLETLSSLLHTSSLSARRNTATLLQNLATSRDQCTLLGSTPAIIEGLVLLLEEDLHRAAVITTLRSLLAICSPLRNRVKAVEAGAVSLLVEILPEAEIATAELALSLLELLCRCAEGRVAVSKHSLTIPVLARKIFGVSDVGTDSAVVILWAICKYSPDLQIQRRVIESGVLSKLFFFVQTDYNARIKLKAADLLKILHNSCRHQIAA